MNILKNLFGSQKKKNGSQPQITENKVIELRNVTKVKGLDSDFIDLIFFISEEDKILFKNKLREIIEELGISNETVRTEFMEKFPNHIGSKEINLPFIAELFIFGNTILTVSMPDETIIDSKEGHLEKSGKDKLQNYYTALRLASHNLQIKNERGVLDISEEEKLVLNSLSDFHMDFARINIIFQLGNSFRQQGNYDKMFHYYEIIVCEQFDLSPNTVADFIRTIGNNLYEIGNLKEALRYFKKGLDLNPKLGVKKVVNEIEKTMDRL